MFDFELELENLDNVPDEFKGLYTAGDDGKFKLNDKLATKLGNGAGAARALTAERTAKNALDKLVKKFKELAGVETPEELEARLQELEAKADKATGAEDRIAQVRADVEKTLGARIKELETALATERTESDTDHRDRVIVDAISSKKGIPEALKPILKERVKASRGEDGKRVLQVIDDDNQPVLDGHGNPISVDAYVEKLRANERYGFAFEPTGTQGAGSGTGAGPKTMGNNPFKAETRNLTAAQDLIRTNPDRARALANQANYPVTW